jgi:hypothetical protein
LYSSITFIPQNTTNENSKPKKTRRKTKEEDPQEGA